MKLFNRLFAAMTMLLMVACETPYEDSNVYPTLDSLDQTMWWSYDQKEQIYYDIWYDGEGRGRMLGYDSDERVNQIINRPFSYTFTPATDLLDGVVRLNFDDGIYYGGILIPKGQFYINNVAVYIIQLYEVDAEGEIIYDMEGNMKSTLQMWKE